VAASEELENSTGGGKNQLLFIWKRLIQSPWKAHHTQRLSHPIPQHKE